jgi:hypothetical protein
VVSRMPGLGQALEHELTDTLVVFNQQQFQGNSPLRWLILNPKFI